MDVPKYFRSLTRELESVKDRVRNFIDHRHWLTDGEWKESVLRSLIGQRLPGSANIGRGFVITETGPTTQCDILVYRADCPVLFREGDLAFVTPDSVLAIIEVKSTATKPVFTKAVEKLAAIGLKLGQYREHCRLGLFAYETSANHHEWALDKLQGLCHDRSQVVDLVNLGCSTFIRYWYFSPNGGSNPYEKWHSYSLTNMSAGYFAANVLDHISPESIARHIHLWFPEDSKEINRISIRPRAVPPTKSA